MSEQSNESIRYKAHVASTALLTFGIGAKILELFVLPEIMGSDGIDGMFRYLTSSAANVGILIGLSTKLGLLYTKNKQR